MDEAVDFFLGIFVGGHFRCVRDGAGYSGKMAGRTVHRKWQVGRWRR